MRISTLAYDRHYGVPTFEAPDNNDVMVATMRSTIQCKEPYVFDKNLAHVKKWFDHLLWNPDLDVAAEKEKKGTADEL